MKMPSCRKSANIPASGTARIGFSLVEVLACIGVVAILMTLLVVGIQRVRSSAEMVKCTSNLRQIGSGLALFVADNHGYLPARYRFNPDAGVSPSLPNRYWTARLLREGFIDNPNVLYSPLIFPYDHQTAINHTGDENADILTRGGLTYGMRRWAPQSSGPWGGSSNDDQPIGMIEDPSNFFLVTTSMWISNSATGRPTQSYSVSPAQSNQRIYLSHQGEANVLFADFHVERKGADYFESTVNEEQAPYNNNARFTLFREGDAISP